MSNLGITSHRSEENLARLTIAEIGSSKEGKDQLKPELLIKLIAVSYEEDKAKESKTKGTSSAMSWSM